MTKALFLDRDGVINEDLSYVYKTQDFRFREGVFDLLKYAQELGYILIVVTNQSGIARGIFTEEDYSVLTEYMINELKKEGVSIAGVYHCPYHKSNHEKFKEHEPDRKPNPGMFLKAQQDFDIDLAQSVMLGDKKSDSLAAKSAGIIHRYCIQTLYELDNNAQIITSFAQMKQILKDLKEAET